MTLRSVFAPLALTCLSLPAFLAGGCATAALDCRDGFTRADDGRCYPPAPDPDLPTVDDVLASLGPCEPLKDGDQIDVVGGCFEGACALGAFPAVDEALGGGADCGSDGATWTCTWDQGVLATFPVGANDPGKPAASAITPWVRGLASYEGASPDGLGVQISVRCYVDVLGPPEVVVFEDLAGTLVPTYLSWGDYGVEIIDVERKDRNGADPFVPDGLVDELTLSGPS